MNPRIQITSAIAVGVVAGGLLVAAGPADAASPMPRILLKGGAAEVSRTYTATASGRAYPAGSKPRYQWYRGNKSGDASSFKAISGATHQRYKLTNADHAHTVKVRVKAVKAGRVIGTKESGASNWIMYNMAPPVLHGAPHAGSTIAATLGPWSKEWTTHLYWRRTGNNIKGQNGLKYRAKAADVGKEISLLAIGEHTYPNGVHAIDRYAARMRITYASHAKLTGASRSAGHLNLTAFNKASIAKASSVRGRAMIYDGKRMVKSVWITGGHKVVRLGGLSRGYHNIKMVFRKNPWFGGSTTVRRFFVR